MYTHRHGLIIGFHGCDEEIQKAIIAGTLKDLTPSENNWDWLGHGIYFWENNPLRAFDFAIEQAQRKNNSITNVAVIGAVIDLGYCLDLTDMTNIQMVKKNFETLRNSFDQFERELPRNSNSGKGNDLIFRNLDCLVINSLHASQDLVKPFDSVRGIFTEGEELYENAGFREKDHIQICIRNINCIKGYFLPRKKRNQITRYTL